MDPNPGTSNGSSSFLLRPNSHRRTPKADAWLPVWVEAQDETGKPLPGYTFEDAVSVDRNGVAQEVWWRGGPDVGLLSGRTVRMRVTMRSAKLYAFQFSESSR